MTACTVSIDCLTCTIPSARQAWRLAYRLLREGHATVTDEQWTARRSPLPLIDLDVPGTYVRLAMSPAGVVRHGIGRRHVYGGVCRGLAHLDAVERLVRERHTTFEIYDACAGIASDEVYGLLRQHGSHIWA